MSSAMVSSKGRIVIPQAIREALGIRPGHVLEFLLDGSGGMSVRRADRIPLASLKGAWKKAGDTHLTDANIAAAIADAARRRRSTRSG